MKTIEHTFLTGETTTIEVTYPVAAHVARVAAVEASGAGRFEVESLVYGPENPLLTVHPETGRANVTPETLASPAYRVLHDLLDRARVREGTLDPAASAAACTLPTKDAADLLGISEAAVRLACAAGRLAHRKVGAVLLIDPRSVDAYRATRRGPRPAGAIAEGGKVEVRLGSADGISFSLHAKGSELVATEKLHNAVLGHLEGWSELAVLIGEGARARYLLLRPADPGEPRGVVDARRFYARGPFYVAQQERNPSRARALFREFRASAK